MDASTFLRYYKELYLPLGMYALRITGDVDTAQDVVQTAFAAAWEKISEGGEISSMKAYMYRAVHNGALALMKADARISNIEEFIDREVSEDDIDTSERDAALWQAIDSLPQKCREIFLMSKRDGYSNAEIAEELGISVKTVENQMTKAFSRLRGDSRLSHGKIFFLPFL